MGEPQKPNEETPDAGAPATGAAPASPLPAPEAPKPAEKPDAATAESPAAKAETQKALAELKATVASFAALVKKKGFDFEGDNDDTATIAKNKVFIALRGGLEAFVSEAHNIDAPAEIKKAWADAAANFLAEEIATFDGSYGEMTEDHAKHLLEILRNPTVKTEQTQRSGIGTFEQWVDTSTHKTRYTEYKKQKVDEAARVVAAEKTKADSIALATATTAAAIEKTKGGFSAHMTDIKGIFEGLPEANRPAGLDQEIAAIEAEIQKYDGKDATKKEHINTSLAQVEAKVNKAVEDKGVLEAKTDEKPALVDEILGYVKKMPPTSKWRARAEGIVESIAKYFKDMDPNGAMATVLAWIGITRGAVVSEEYLAEKFDDPRAKQVLVVKAEFRKFGLPGSLGSEYAEVPVKDLVAKLAKPEDISKKTDHKPKLEFLLRELKSHGGATSEKPVTDFMNDKSIWKLVAYSPKSKPAAPAATPPAGPATPLSART